MELRGSLSRSVRLFLKRDAVDSVEAGSERRHLSSTGTIVAPFVASQGLEVRVLHDPSIFCISRHSLTGGAWLSDQVLVSVAIRPQSFSHSSSGPTVNNVFIPAASTTLI